jgi:hypothetical protein
MLKRIDFLLAILFLFFLSDIFAESIVLKSGKTVEGKIVKKTDRSILLDVGGITIDYYFDEIVSIDGKEISNGEIFSTDKGKTSRQSPVLSQNKTLLWQEWYNQVKGYLDKFEEINKKSQNLAQEENEKLEKAKNNVELQKEILRESIKALETIFNEFELLKPPAELENFHNKLIESYGYIKEINEAALRNDNDSAYMYSQTINNLTLEAFTDLKNLYLKYGAPQEKIDSINKIIAKYVEKKRSY